MKQWLDDAMVFFQQETSNKEFIKAGKDAHKIFKKELSTALFETANIIFEKAWFEDHINMKFGDHVPCDSGDCYYEDHPTRIGEFDGTIYRLRFSEDNYRLCDICYENGGTEAGEELIDIDNYVKDLCKRMKEK